MHVLRLFSILLGMLTCPCDTIIPGSRLLDFPNPDFSRTLTFPTHEGKREVRLEHNLGKLPFHVRVYATARDGLNKKFVFEATGGCQNDERPSSGLIFGYDDTAITVWAPRSASSRRTGDGSMIYIGEPWGGIKGGGHPQDSKTVSLTVEAWRSGPVPTYETKIDIDAAARSTFHVSHTLRQVPELISVRVTPKIGGRGWSSELEGMHFHGVGSVHTSGSRRTGGVVFAYNVRNVILWTSKKPKSGCVFIGKNWRRGGVFSSRRCRVEIRLWVNAFPPPVYQSDWTNIGAGTDHPSFLEVHHNIRMLPTYVRVQYRFSDTADPLVFEGVGSLQSPRVRSRFGGLAFAYDKFKVRVWLPWLPNGRHREDASVIFVGDGWGDGDAVYNKSAQFRVQVMADKCHDATRVVDGQGYCRDTTEVHLRPSMTSWDLCSEPCGTGLQKRKVKGCTGVSLKTILDCTFSNKEDNCGLNPVQDPSKFPWLGSHDNGLHGRKTMCSSTGRDDEEERERMAFLDEVKVKQPNFVFSQPKTCDQRKGVWVNRRQGVLESRDLGNATGCILTFKYTARSYFHHFQIDVIPSGQETYPEDMEPLWMLEGGNVQPGVWRSGYLNIGHRYSSIRKFRFVHKLPYTNPSRNPDLNPKCPGQCHSVLLSEVKLMCEVGDAYRVGEKKCTEKKLPKPSCVVDAFEPFSKGPAWSVEHSVRNMDNTNLGHFVSANGSRGDLIASYMFNVVVSDVYHLWFESFSVSNETNDITIEILGHDKFDDYLIYNGERPIWLPLDHKLKFSAGVHTIKLYQREKQFKFRNLMISPRSISVYSALGMQSQLIPNSNFNTLSKIKTLLGYARLNGIGAWAPTDKSTGQMFFEVQFPEVALVNKIATQGGRSLDRGRRGASFEGYMQSYRLKFSLHHKIIHESFAYYRENIKEKHPYEFPANKDVDGIVEHKLKFTIVARAVRLYPINFTWPLALRVEVYGFYMLKGMCPDIPIKIRERECTGDGVCASPNQQCYNDTINLTSRCECNQGFYGNKCEKTGCAGQPCVKGSCVEVGGSFQCNCQPGFYGRYCQSPCPKGRFGVGCVDHCNCSTREQCDAATGYCSCPPGYQGDGCHDNCNNNTYGHNCSMKCNCTPPLQCHHVDGSCYCPHGFHGNQCDVRCRNETFGRNCTQRCDCQNQGVCNQDGKCDCPAGWFGDKCQQGCPAGWYGRMCHHQCHRQGNARCDPVTGEQTCVEGFMGRFCNKRCPKGRYGVSCLHKCGCEMTNTLQCTKDHGVCHCKPGWTGNNCAFKCHESWGPQCAHACECQNGGICDHVTGRCTCRRGHNGTRCEKQCDGGQYGTGCMETGSCAQGYFGVQCKGVCDCNPETTDICNPENGKCYCAPGHEGERCEDKCDRNHFGMNCASECRCENEATCDNRDGFCYCQPGWHGQFCQQECQQGTYGDNCKLNCKCKNGAHCDRMDGSCKCAAGYEGTFCEKACHAGTYGNACQHTCQCRASTSLSCDNVNGSCLCKPGYKGRFCQEVCDDGYYGNGCQQPCPLCRHSNHACNKINGTCSCINGFTGPHCMDDCPMSRYGPDCAHECRCNSTELCDNMDGTCYPSPDFVFHLNLLFNCYALQSQHFVGLKDKLKENTALLVYNCLTESGVAPHCLETNETKYSVVSDHRWSIANRKEVLREIALVNTFFVRIVSMVPKYSLHNEPVCTVSMSLLNNTQPVNGTVIEAMLVQLPTSVVTKALTYMQEQVYLYYRGVTYDEKRRVDEIMTKMQWIVIGLSSFGGLLTVFLVCLICRCTKRAPYPPPFQKVRRDSKDFEMQANMTCNSHLLAFENPYYDVIAAMGLDDDIEEDYYNPLYDNMYGIHHNSDSETEPEDMYYFFRNNNYHRDSFRRDSTHYSYDKDSGFSSGHLM